MLAQELEAGVLLQRAGQQPGLGEHLEAVADADDRAAGGGELARPRPSPARSGRWRRCAGSRRARSRRARTTASTSRDACVAVPQQLGLAAELPRPPTRRRARSWCPGTRTTADPRRSSRAVAARRVHRRSAYASITGLARAARTSRRPAPGPRPRRRRRARGGCVLPIVHLASRWCTRAPGSARSTVAPCGSSDAGQVRDVDWPRTRTDRCTVTRLVSVPVVEARAGQQLVGLDVAAPACPSITSAGMCGAGGVLVPPGRQVSESRTYCLSNDGGDVPTAYSSARPVARRVGRHHLVDHDELAVELAELELGVGEDQPALVRRARRRTRRSASVRSRSSLVDVGADQRRRRRRR